MSLLRHISLSVVLGCTAALLLLNPGGGTPAASAQTHAGAGGVIEPAAAPVEPTTYTVRATCPGDLNGDGLVNTLDLGIVLANYGANCNVCTTPANCTVYPNMFATCVAGVCQYSCNTNFANCNNILTDGCEVSLLSDVNNCGACNVQCAPVPNGTPACVSGSCTIGTCIPGFSNCNLSVIDGCETPLGTPTNCASCGNACSFPNCSATCVSGSCQIVACNSGYDNCDSVITNGCETAHFLAVNTCTTASDLGSMCADTTCGIFCSGGTGIIGPVVNGNRSAWYKMRATECAGGCPGSLLHTVQLLVPSGINYDLYVYSSCSGALIGSSTNGAGTNESVPVAKPRTGADDSFDYWIEVRYISGSSCTNWMLQIFGRSC